MKIRIFFGCDAISSKNLSAFSFSVKQPKKCYFPGNLSLLMKVSNLVRKFIWNLFKYQL